MINFHVGPLYSLQHVLWHEEQRANIQLGLITMHGNHHPKVQPWPQETDQARISGAMRALLMIANNLGLEATRNRITRFTMGLSQPCTVNYVESELRTLRETMDDELQYERFFHYPRAKSLRILTIPGDWATALAAFPSAKKDIEEAVDCYALDHNTACVFHLMRVLEHGLRAFAADVGKSFDIQNWQNIIDEIESAIRVEAKGLPRGAPRMERLQFLSEAAKEFHYFKDGWRNYVSHNRVEYDEHQCLSALEHTRSFMNAISSRLSEVS